VALLSLRSGQAQLKAAELSALARRFRSLSSVQWEEGQALDAVATQAALSVTPSVPGAPVAPVSAEIVPALEPLAPVEGAATAEAPARVRES
jgi:hypothetical protein